MNVLVEFPAEGIWWQCWSVYFMPIHFFYSNQAFQNQSIAFHVAFQIELVQEIFFDTLDGSVVIELIGPNADVDGGLHIKLDVTLLRSL